MFAYYRDEKCMFGSCMCVMLVFFEYFFGKYNIKKDSGAVNLVTRKLLLCKFFLSSCPWKLIEQLNMYHTS